MAKLLAEWPEMGVPRQVFEGLIAPVWGGVSLGLAAQSSAIAYGVNLALAIGGSVLLGLQHRLPLDAARRGAVSGALYALTFLATLHLRQVEPVLPWWLLPRSDLADFVLLAGPAIPLHLYGSALRRRRLAAVSEVPLTR